MRMVWIEHQGRKILYGDYRGLTDKQMVENMDLGYRMMRETPGQVMVLANVQGSLPVPVFMEHYKLTNRTKNARLISKLAVVGTKTGVEAMLLQEMSANTGIVIQPFNTENEAKDWLIG